MKVRKKCSTCRHYEPSPIRGQGWCRNPLLRKPHERSLVGASELVCDKKFYDFWEPLSARRGEAAQRKDAGQGSDAGGPRPDPSGGRGVAGAQRTRSTGGSWLPDLSTYLNYVYVLGAGVALAAVVMLSGLLAGSVESGQPASPTPTTAAPSPTIAVTIPSLIMATPTATALPPTATPTPVPPTAIVVANTDGDGVYIRRTPVLGDRITAWPDGTVLEVVGPDVTSEGQTWKHVKDPKGNVGYVPARYTKPRD